jgi:uncharacterized SAM-binding protein YcdF (DUF218 family)
MHQEPKPADAILLLCSYDSRVAVRAAELFEQGLGKYVIVSGGTGPTTPKHFDKPESELFADILAEHGVSRKYIIIENKSMNTGENMRFTYELLQKRSLNFESLLLVQKPFMERRTYATFRKQWPDPDTEICVTSPQILFDEYYGPEITREHLLNNMAGDMQRIREYPGKGFQIPQEIPDEVWQAYEMLIAAGYTSGLIKH